MIVKCENGHWYDASTNRSCPHCKQESEKLSLKLDDIEEDDKTISFAEVDAAFGSELDEIIAKSPMDQSVVNASVPASDSEEDDDKTISFGLFEFTNTEPVTGWLVCMSGDERGKDFRLRAGKNHIGRSLEMDVVLLEDKKVARDKHCSIIYDPKSNYFFLSSESGNLTYLNQKPMRIDEGDEITIGDTTLRFVPFCKEEVTWENQ